MLALLAGCAADAPAPSPPRSDLRIGAEVFRMFCMRIARDEFPTDPDGAPFVAACEGSGPAPADARARRLPALVARREEIVAALDQVFAEADGQAVAGVSGFADNELRGFLASLIPFYDDETLPRSTRALASVAGKLLDRADPRGQQVLDTLARLSARSGYRAEGDALGAVRPLLAYPRLDPLAQQLLGFVGEGGAGHETFLELLRAAALELAEPAEPAAEVQQSSLRLLADLLLSEDASFASPDDPVKHYVRRDEAGDAILQAANPAAPIAPFARYGRTDRTARGSDGRALIAPGAALAHGYGDANRTLLAALLRDQHALLEREAPDQPSSVEKLLRGLRPLLGPAKARKHAFSVRAADATQPGRSGELEFPGLSVEDSPLLDLAHALAQLLRYPETDRLLAALLQLVRAHESAAAAAVYAGLAVDRRADEHPAAQLTGVDGAPGTPQEFWDDVIGLGMRIAARPGQFRDIAAALTMSEASAAQGRLVARLMGFKDELTYAGAPLRPGDDGRFSEADAAALNAPISLALAAPVQRVPGGDVGMNRSLFQRLLSTIRVTNGAANCNKDGARLAVEDPTTGTPLTFPDPTARPAPCHDDPLCDAAAATAYTAIDLLCPHGAGAPSERFRQCEFIRQPSGAEFFMRSFLGKAQVTLKDAQLSCLVGAGLAGDPGEIQAAAAQLAGFTLNPSTASITRFLYAPRNRFLGELFTPTVTIDGVALSQYEPNLLFALEAKDPATTVGGQPLSFLSASKELVAAFDRHETFESTADGQVAKDGYLFADLFSVLHTHWPSRRPGECPRGSAEAVCGALGLTGDACNAGCTQSADPARPFYAKQSNLVSYEPLLIEALAEERLGELLAVSARALAALRIDCEDGVRRDGLTILGDFLERILTPDPDLASYGAKRKYTKTNTCTGERDSASCGCPRGSEPRDALDPASACVLPDGGIVPRGRILPQTTPLHLMLDALRRIDETFAEAAFQDRLQPWREARGALVDLYLTVSKTPAADAADDPAKATYALSNPRSRELALRLLSFLRARIAQHRESGQAKLEGWAAGLPDRLARVLAHPLVARGLELFDQLWEERGAAGPADELARVSSFLLDPAVPERFAGVALSAADTLHLVDRDRELSPAIQFGALLLAENAFTALDSLASTPEPPNTERGSAQCALELTRKIADLQRDKPSPSALARLLQNAVQPDPSRQDSTPLEILLDAVADVNRADPSLPTSQPHSAEDMRAVFEQLRAFLSDPDRGLERLYSVVRARTVR